MPRPSPYTPSDLLRSTKRQTSGSEVTYNSGNVLAARGRSWQNTFSPGLMQSVANFLLCATLLLLFIYTFFFRAHQIFVQSPSTPLHGSCRISAPSLNHSSQDVRKLMYWSCSHDTSSAPISASLCRWRSEWIQYHLLQAISLAVTYDVRVTLNYAARIFVSSKRKDFSPHFGNNYAGPTGVLNRKLTKMPYLKTAVFWHTTPWTLGRSEPKFQRNLLHTIQCSFRMQASPKSRYTTTRLHGVASNKTTPFRHDRALLKPHKYVSLRMNEHPTLKPRFYGVKNQLQWAKFCWGAEQIWWSKNYRILCNPNVHYYDHQSLSLVRNISEMNFFCRHPPVMHIHTIKN